jgi:LmbE family N-acetylglucosaminyl deacetylase
MTMTAVAIVAHADDETLGCGATLALLADAGWEVRPVVVTDGRVTTRSGADVDNTAAARAAADVLGIGEPTFLPFADQYLDTVPMADLVNAIAAVVPGADAVFTHSRRDLNSDHRLVAEAVAVLVRSAPSFGSVLACESPGEATWNGDAFRATFFVDVTVGLERKLAAMQEYRSELRPPPHPRSIEALGALAVVRGSEAGFAVAEGFELLRGYPGVLSGLGVDAGTADRVT